MIIIEGQNSETLHMDFRVFGQAGFHPQDLFFQKLCTSQDAAEPYRQHIMGADITKRSCFTSMASWLLVLGSWFVLADSLWLVCGGRSVLGSWSIRYFSWGACNPPERGLHSPCPLLKTERLEDGRLYAKRHFVFKKRIGWYLASWSWVCRTVQVTKCGLVSSLLPLRVLGSWSSKLLQTVAMC